MAKSDCFSVSFMQDDAKDKSNLSANCFASTKSNCYKYTKQPEIELSRTVCVCDCILIYSDGSCDKTSIQIMVSHDSLPCSLISS